jgi:hypothetical protein
MQCLEYEFKEVLTMVVLWTGSPRFPKGDTSGGSQGRGWLLASLSWLKIEYFEMGVELLSSSGWQVCPLGQGGPGLIKWHAQSHCAEPQSLCAEQP